ncbi:MAG: hypothetical protein V2I47_01140 [Bacteroidales bacterium]|jgi:hypothetical protein|nr:hypothetical protein [Bacteroidales bacterium]
MKLDLRKSFSFFLGMIFLVSTSGFTIFKHHCYTKNSSQFSFLIEDFNCDHNGHEHQHALPACCAENTENTGASCEDGSCCDTESYIVKLDVTLDQQKAPKNPIPATESGEPVNHTESPYLTQEDKHFILHNNLPPPLSGKALHIFLHQLKFDCFSV